MITWRSVRRILVQRCVGVALLAALTLARLLTDAGMRPDQATEAYLLAMTAVVLRWCSQPLLSVVARERPQSAPQPRADLGERPDRLVAMEESVTLAVRSAYVRDRRLRPTFRTLLAERLRRHGLDLDRDPRVPAILGRTGSWLASPQEEADLDDSKAGLTPAQLTELADVLATLEQRLTTHVRATGEQH